MITTTLPSHRTVKSWLELCVFTENLAKLLDAGIICDKAFDVAGQDLRYRVNQTFIRDLRKAFLDGSDLNQALLSYRFPSFYVAMLKCGQQTGRLPESLRSAAYFLRQTIPLTSRLGLYWRLAICAYLVNVLFKFIFLQQLAVIALAILAVILLLPAQFESIRYWRHWLAAKLPFIGTWSRQLALMQFFICLKIACDSTLSAFEMLQHSVSTIDNVYLRNKMQRSLDLIENGHSFTEALQASSLVYEGMIPHVRTAEDNGTLDRCFADFTKPLKQVVEAKLESIKPIVFIVGINCGLLAPLLLMLPLVLPAEFVRTANYIIAGIMAVAMPHCIRASIYLYREKAAGLDLWFL